MTRKLAIHSESAGILLTRVVWVSCVYYTADGAIQFLFNFHELNMCKWSKSYNRNVTGVAHLLAIICWKRGL